jgi:hypothetical protein
MVRHSRKASLLALALILGGIGLWALRAAAPPAVRAAPAEKKGKRVRLRDRDFRAALSRRFDFPGMDDPKMTLAEALGQLTKLTGIVFEVYEKAFRFEQLNDVTRTPITEKEPIPAKKRARRRRRC